MRGSSNPWWASRWVEIFSVTLGVLALALALEPIFKLDYLGLLGQILAATSLVSFTISCLAAFVSIRIFRMQTQESIVSREEQRVLLEKIERSTSSARSSAYSANVNTVEIIGLLREASLARNGIQNDDFAEDVDEVVALASALGGLGAQILWVDDDYYSIVGEVAVFRSAKVGCVWVGSSDDAIRLLQNNEFSVIISDMGRPESPRAGYELLEDLRRRMRSTPFVIYSGSNKPAHLLEAKRKGAAGATNSPFELFEMVSQIILRDTRLTT